MRKIAVVTGTRAEYGYLKPLMVKIEKEDDLELIPIVTGMHLLDDFGDTYKIVENDFPNAIKVPMEVKDDSLKEMALYLSSGIKNFANYLEKSDIDILVVLGDRSEAFAAALAALYLNIPIAHINGGDVTGGIIDEQIRTKEPSAHIFLNRSGNPLSRFGIYGIIVKYKEKASRSRPSLSHKTITPHTIRHYAASPIMPPRVVLTRFSP